MRCEWPVQQYAVKIITLRPVNVAFLELSKLPNFYDRAVEGNNSWIYSHHNTHHKYANSCVCEAAFVDEAVDGCHTKTPSRTLMWIMSISNTSRIIQVWKWHTVGITLSKCGIRVALWLWKVSHINLKVTFDDCKKQSPLTSCWVQLASAYFLSAAHSRSLWMEVSAK